MTAEQLRRAYQARPFIPFTISMGDGRRFRVPHSEFMIMTQSGRVACVVNEDDTFSVLDLLLMTELQLDTAPRTTPNGSVGGSPVRAAS